jgi:hypothetical protein
MAPEDFEYAKTYSAMSDEELLQVARDRADLVESAKTILDKELDRRGLKLEVEKEAGSTAPFYCPTCNRDVDDPLTCGECSSTICRVCGTALRMSGDAEDDEADSRAAAV